MPDGVLYQQFVDESFDIGSTAALPAKMLFKPGERHFFFFRQTHDIGRCTLMGDEFLLPQQEGGFRLLIFRIRVQGGQKTP